MPIDKHYYTKQFLLDNPDEMFKFKPAPVAKIDKINEEKNEFKKMNKENKNRIKKEKSIKNEIKDLIVNEPKIIEKYVKKRNAKPIDILKAKLVKKYSVKSKPNMPKRLREHLDDLDDEELEDFIHNTDDYNEIQNIPNNIQNALDRF